MIITIHKHGCEGLEKTVNSVMPALKCKGIAGYLVYESGGKSLSESLTSSAEVAYVHDAPLEGISEALNKAVREGEKRFRAASHHTFVHSGDTLEMDGEELGLISVEADKQGLDLLFGLRVLEKGETRATTQPDFDKIGRGMTVGHIGSVISNRIHQEVGGYCAEFRLAMDYDFMLNAYIAGAKNETYMKCITVMNENGESARNAFRALGEVYKIRCEHQLEAKWKLRMEYCIDCTKRFLYERLESRPHILVYLRRLVNKNLAKP